MDIQGHISQEQVQQFLMSKKSNINCEKILSAIDFLKDFRYTVLKLIDCGGYGLVMLAFDDNNNRNVAIKLIIVSEINTLEDLISEYQKACRFNHPNIIKCYQSLYDKANLTFFIVSEYCKNGNLLNYYNSKQMSEQEIIAIISSIIQAVMKMHSIRMIHGDLKPQNILISDNFEAIVCDLGISKVLIQSKNQTCIEGGSILYSAPEQSKGELMMESDTFSIGVVLSFLSGLKIEGDDLIVAFKLKSGDFPSNLENRFKKILEIAYKMMQINPSQRLSLKDSLEQLSNISQNSIFNEEGEYKGQMILDKRHGKGLQIYHQKNPIIKYDGEWVNDQYCGQGQIEYRNGSKYEGQFVDGDYSGNGIFYFQLNSEFLQYRGHFLNNQMNGQGIFEWKNGDKYEGDFKDNFLCGKGIFYYRESSQAKRYEGEYLNTNMNGYGILEWKNGDKYEGTFKDGSLCGKGIYYYRESSEQKRYEGEYLKNVRNGYGVLEWKNGGKYEGNFKDGFLSGKGIYFYSELSERKRYEGEYLNHKMNGYGVLEWKNGVKYEGNFKDSLRSGKGIYYYNDSSEYERYEGEYLNDKMNGYGVLEWKDGGKYEGNFKDGFLSGKGIFYYSDSSEEKRYEGEFLNGKMNGYGILEYKNGKVQKGMWENNYL